jgi:hypothetical protein
VKYASITTDTGGRLTDDSTLCVDGQTTPVPTRAEVGGRFAPRRIVEALAERGYQPATNYYADLQPHDADGYLNIAIVPLDGAP